jgi:hypothetical protein
MGQWANQRPRSRTTAHLFGADNNKEAGSDVLRREAEAKPKNESYSTVQVARSGPPDKQTEWLTFVSFLFSSATGHQPRQKIMALSAAFRIPEYRSSIQPVKSCSCPE